MAEAMLTPTKFQKSRPIRRLIGRLWIALALSMIGVPIFLRFVYPAERLPSVSFCGHTPENDTLTLGWVLLAIHFGWKILSALNDRAERYFTAIDDAARSRYLAQQAETIRTPQPLDDF